MGYIIQLAERCVYDVHRVLFLENYIYKLQHYYTLYLKIFLGIW